MISIFKFLTFFLTYFFCFNLYPVEIKKVRFGSDENKNRIVFDLSESSLFDYKIEKKKIIIKLKSSLIDSRRFKTKVNKHLSSIKVNEVENLIELNFLNFFEFQKLFLIKGEKFSRLVFDYKIKAFQSVKKKRVVVIDPGHGGKDSGAVGVKKILEKNVTLVVAKKLREKFSEKKNYEIILTRNKDKYLKLRDRVKVARKHKADLFLSLHADYHRNKKISGVSIYTLSENASDKEAAALAKRENKEDLIEGLDLSTESREVTNILIDLAQRETMNQSSIFVDFLIKEFKKNTKLLQRTHRFAGFAVLKAPDVPSVLIEMGYLSNLKDSGLLTDSRYHNKLVNNIISSVENYFKWKENTLNQSN